MASSFAPVCNVGRCYPSVGPVKILGKGGGGVGSLLFVYYSVLVLVPSEGRFSLDWSRIVCK